MSVRLSQYFGCVCVVALAMSLNSCDQVDSSGFVEGSQTATGSGTAQKDPSTGFQQQILEYSSVQTGLALSGLLVSDIAFPGEDEVMVGCGRILATGGNGTIYGLDREGNYNELFVDTLRRDFQALCVDAGTGDLLMAVQGEQRLCRLHAPDYDSLSVTKVVQVDPEDGAGQGLRAIFWKDANTIFAGNHSLPCAAAEFSPDTAYVRRLVHLPQLESLTDMAYDPDTGLILALDGKSRSLAVFDRNFKFLYSYPLSFIERKEDPEALAIDKSRGVVMVGCAGSGRLYTISLAL